MNGCIKVLSCSLTQSAAKRSNKDMQHNKLAYLFYVSFGVFADKSGGQTKKEPWAPFLLASSFYLHRMHWMHVVM